MCCQMNLVSRQICTADRNGGGSIAMTLPADPCPPVGSRRRIIPRDRAAPPRPSIHPRPATHPRPPPIPARPCVPAGRAPGVAVFPSH